MTQPVSELHENEARASFEQVDEQLSRLLRKAETSELTEGEQRRLRELDEQADALFQTIQTRAAAKPARRGPHKPMPETTVSVGQEEPTYRPDTRSYFSDLFRAKVFQDFDAIRRLQRHEEEVKTSPEYRDLTRAETTGGAQSQMGQLVPPAWLVDAYVPGLRAGRVAANLVQNLPLPQFTDSINIPKISTNPTVAAQTADNAVVNEVDAGSATVTAPVQTFAGQNDVAVQLLEQSPLAMGFDNLIFNELLADLDRYTDAQVINGAGTSGEITGILRTTSIGTKAYTDATVTLAELFPIIVQAKNVVEKTIYRPCDAILMHPRRWNWMLSILDSSSRPFVTSASVGQNPVAIAQSVNAEGPVGAIAGLPVYVSANVPITLTNGAGSAGTEDIIIVGRFAEAVLFESSVRLRVLPEVLSGTLTTRLQAYAYKAFTAARIPQAFCTVYDTGLQGSQISAF